ncbi:phospholipase D-like domain-containing protein [soil metagenome]
MDSSLLAIALLGEALGPLSWLEVALLVVVAILAFMIWVLTHHKPCRYGGEPDTTIIEGLRAVAGSTHSQILSGNAATLVRDADFFDIVCDDIARAQRSVHLETYLWVDGDATARVVAALSDAARRGVAVRVLVDALGGSKLESGTAKELRDAGCDLHRFRRWRLVNFGRFNVRDHRKIVTVDGMTAIVGGHCMHDRWMKDTDDARQCRDISVRIRGPVVSSVQSVFLENWQEVTDQLFVDDTTFPEIAPQGEINAHVAYVHADNCASSVQVLHHLAISFAKERIRIQNPYFLPNPRGARALKRAARRGVDVRIMTPSVEASDSPVVQRASHFLYRGMLEAGIRIFEYQPTLLHQKVITIDGVWCGIGSSNFDDRSFEINDEVTVGLADPGLVAELDAGFDHDALQCQERTLKEWATRSRSERLLSAICYLFDEQL